MESLNSKGGVRMSNFRCVILIAAAAVLVWSAQAISAQYYITESESGIIAITDHEPEEGAIILKGPFETRDAAEEALTDEEKEKLGTRGTGEEKGKCRGKGSGKGKGRGKNR
jgi:hypothetical protein